MAIATAIMRYTVRCAIKKYNRRFLKKLVFCKHVTTCDAKNGKDQFGLKAKGQKNRELTGHLAGLFRPLFLMLWMLWMLLLHSVDAYNAHLNFSTWLTRCNNSITQDKQYHVYLYFRRSRAVRAVCRNFVICFCFI